MNEEKKFYFPKVLFIGNGINRAFNGDAWGSLILKMWQNPRVPSGVKGISALPYPLQVVLATDDHVDSALKEKCCFSTIEGIPELSEIYKRLLCTGFDHILTTNYTYELEKVAYPNVKNIENYIAKSCISHTDASKKAEPKYMLHTYYDIDLDGHENKVWHIHGEARKSDSIVLGHYYYGRMLYKYQEELGKRQNIQLERQADGKGPVIDSWLDAFIMGEVHVIGFGYDFSEFDLWWLLNRKKREAAEHGKLYFYEPSFGNEMKHELLRAYGAEVTDLGFSEKGIDFKQFYKKAIDVICNRSF